MARKWWYTKILVELLGDIMAYEDPTFATSASAIPRMKVNVDLNNLERTFFTVDEWYSPEELNAVWKEIDFLTDFKKFTFDGSTLQIDLDNSYANKDISNILSYRYKDKLELFANQVDRTFPEQIRNEFLNCTEMKTQLRYFHQSMGWEEHISDDKFVSYHFLWKEPKSYDGGDLKIADAFIKSHQSRLVFMKGNYPKTITGVNFIDPKRTLGNGLYLITTSYN